MFGRFAAVLITAGALIALPAFAQETSDGALADWDAEPVSRVAPQYPSNARIAGVEGWVHARLAIQPDGSVANVEIIDSYPRGYFEPSVTEALKQSKYAHAPGPRTHNVLTHFTIEGAAAVRPDVGRPLERARTLLGAPGGDRAKTLDQVGALLKQASDVARLNIYEFTALEQSYGFLAFERQDYAAAITHLQRARRFGYRLAESEQVAARGQMQESTEAVLISSYLLSGRNAQAVAIYDKWIVDHPKAFTPALRARIADVRTK